MAALQCSVLCGHRSRPPFAPAVQRRTLRAGGRGCRQPVRALFGGNKDGGGGGNPFGKLGDMANMMENVKKAQQLVQVEAAKVQEELANSNFEGYSNDETVRVVMSGNQEPRSVDITEEGHAQGPNQLSVLVTEAMKDAHAKSVTGMKLRMQDLAASLGLPNAPK